MRKLPLFLLVGTAVFLAGGIQAGPLIEAHVTKIINNVHVVDPAKGAHPAALHETVKDDLEVKTGVKSRSELLFQDDTLTRLGPETSFSFKAGTRDLSLKEGTLLLQVPKGLGGAKIRTAAVTAAITGTTIMMEYTPRRHIKVVVLEGSLRLSVNGPSGNSVVVRPGQMILMRPDAIRIPAPVAVDLKKIVQTSSLVNLPKKNGWGSLPSAALIEKEIAKQKQEKESDHLVETGLAIRGSGTTALINGRRIDVLARNEQGRSLVVATTIPSGSTGSVLPGATPSSGSTPAPGSTPVPAASPGPASTPGPTATPAASPAATPPPTPTSGDDDARKAKGDHNNDGHLDNGKGGPTKDHKGHPINRPQPAVDRARVSGRETLSPAARVFRNER